MPNVKPLILIAIISLTSCAPKLAGTMYTGTGPYKQSSIKFLNDTLCEIQQHLVCANIDTQYGGKTILATYKKIRFTFIGYRSTGPIITGPKKRNHFIGIVVKNVNCNNCESYISIPDFYQKGCVEQQDSIVRKIAGFDRIYNFPNDTLLLHKGIIYIGLVKTTIAE